MLISILKPVRPVQGGSAGNSGRPNESTSLHITRYLLLTLACVLAGAAHAQSFVQQGGKLTTAGSLQLGHSVALSADGTTALVGDLGPYGTGGAWVYTRSGGVWTQQGGKLIGSNAVNGQFGYGANQGFSVALSGDGNTAIVGGPGDNPTDFGAAGAAWVWTRSASGVWTQQGSKLVGSGVTSPFGASQGSSVALSPSGTIAIVGGPNEGYPGAGGFWNTGAAWAWKLSAAGVWTQEGRLVGAGAVGDFVEQGSGVAVVGGGVAIVGGPGDNGGIGAAWVWTRSASGVWSQQGNKLVGTGAIGYSRQGYSVALSEDDSTAIVGGPYDNATGNNNSSGGVGAAWVWTLSTAGWTQQRKLAGTGGVGYPRQGWSVALSADGNTALVGGPQDTPDGYGDGAGAAWVWTRSGSSWNQQTKLYGTGAVNGPAGGPSSNQGYSVALSYDGSTAIVGGPLGADGGAVWAFGPPVVNYTISGQVFAPNSFGNIAGALITLAGSQSGSVTTDGSGTYSFAVQAGGNYTVTPSLSGYIFDPPSQNFNTLSGNQTLNFFAQRTAQPQAITFGPLPNVQLGVAPLQIVATTSSGLTVTFTSTTTAVCTVAPAALALVSGGTVTVLAAGTCSITASQAGNTFYAAASPVTQSFTVTSPASTAPLISAAGIVNGQNQPNFPPGSLVAIFGSRLAPSAQSAGGLPLATILNGVTVKMNNIAVPLLYVGPTQINCQIPLEIVPGQMTVTVQNGAAVSNSVTVTVASVAPSIYAILNQDSSRNTAQAPIKAGSFVSLWGTGLGPTSPRMTTGASPPNGPNYAVPTGPVSVTLGGAQPARVDFDAASPGSVGLFQINVQIPASAAPGATNLVLTVSGASSPPFTVYVN